MRLTTFSDYALRTLMYLALHPGRFVTIAEVAGAWRISANHLMKVVRHLAAQGDVTTLRGPHGGVRLARPANEIRLGAVVRAGEPALVLAPASNPTAAGLIHPAGPWGDVLAKALAAFTAVLDECSLADLVADPARLEGLLPANARAPPAEDPGAEAWPNAAGR